MSEQLRLRSANADERRLRLRRVAAVLERIRRRLATESAEQERDSTTERLSDSAPAGEAGAQT